LGTAAAANALPASIARALAIPANNRTGSINDVEHVVFLMQENRSFDHYLGHLPDHGQNDVDVAAPGTTSPTSPDVALSGGAGAIPWYHAASLCTDDPNHSWAGSHAAFAGGKNSGFAMASAGVNDAAGHDRSGSRAMSYYDETDIPFYYRLARIFAISDRYFSDVLGPTLPNRLYLYAGTSFGITDGDIDTDFHRTIFRELNDRNISWKVYRSDVAAGNLTLSFLVDSIGKVASIDDFAEDARNDNLPQVAFIDGVFLSRAAGRNSEEAPADVQIGQHFVYQQVSALMHSPSWATSAMFITYDEAGGFYDHVPPPIACVPDGTRPAGGVAGGFDRYGFRVPLYVVSPFARPHYVSHLVHSHASILRFIETRFGIPALSGRDANADAMLDMFDFVHPPLLTPPQMFEPPIDRKALATCQAVYGP
jgi:phospholipase C